MINYKIDILYKLKEKEYNTNILRKKKLLDEAIIHKLRHNKIITLKALDTICKLTNLQPGDIIEYIEDKPL